MTHRPLHRKPIIGLVGGIGSGKSLVARQLASLGCAVIDADQLAKDTLDQPEVRQQLVRWWGPTVLRADRRVDRRAIAKIVFNNQQQLRRLEALVHPRVHQARQGLRQRYQQDPACLAIVEDCPLLIEAGIDSQCDAVIFVQASREVRLGRVASSRGWSAQQLADREKNQLGLDIKAQHADYIVCNEADENQCLVNVRRVLSQIFQSQS